MALHGRIFLKQSKPGACVFNAILKGLEITGILNGSNLPDSKVWPDMNQPFMLFFAKNRVPADNHHFHFVTPHFEKSLNEKGRFRIDYQSAQLVAASEVVEGSRLLKTLAVGTSLDVEVIRKLHDFKWDSVKSYWKSQGLFSGVGYIISPKQKPQNDASLMGELPDFSHPKDGGFSVDVSLLPKFKDSTEQIDPDNPTALRPRPLELYTSPLLIVPESPGNSISSPKSWIVREPIVFISSYYGYSAHGGMEADLVIALLHLLTHTELFRYYLLVTSSKMGAERRAFQKQDLDNFPFPEIDALSKRQRQHAVKLSGQLETALTKPGNAVNNFIFDLYGLNEYDRQVVKDTLEVSPPYKEPRDRCVPFHIKRLVSSIISHNIYYPFQNIPN